MFRGLGLRIQYPQNGENMALKGNLGSYKVFMSASCSFDGSQARVNGL